MSVRTAPQKVADWFVAFNALRAELTPSAARDVAQQMAGVESVSDLAVVQRMVGLVMANDRAAAVAAAILVANGVKSTMPTEEVWDDE